MAVNYERNVEVHPNGGRGENIASVAGITEQDWNLFDYVWYTISGTFQYFSYNPFYPGTGTTNPGSGGGTGGGGTGSGSGSGQFFP